MANNSFDIRTYLLHPGKKITFFEPVLADLDSYFIPVDDALRIEPLLAAFDERHISGFIHLSYWGESILDATYYDYIDQWWGYLLDMIEKVRRDREAESTMPDQPIRLSFKLVGGDQLAFSISADGGRHFVLPAAEFLCVLAGEAEHFFATMLRYWSGNESYEHYLAKALRLRSELSCR
ncbi:MAG: hypothetical protein JST22_07680 [Bacteroidetes bacterium]|nr:hypothetical protein [Bacteroidota bacterium]